MLAAMVCAEELEKLVQTARPELWLQRVKNLHMPIEFLCKEESAQRRGSRCHQLLRELRWVPSSAHSPALCLEALQQPGAVLVLLFSGFANLSRFLLGSIAYQAARTTFFSPHLLQIFSLNLAVSSGAFHLGSGVI